MTSRDAMRDFGLSAYFVGVPFLIGGVLLGSEDITLVGVGLVLVSIAVIAAS